MTISTKYDLGDIVFIKTDTEQYPKQIVQIKVDPNGVLYELQNGGFTSWHFDMEFTREKDILKLLDIES